MRKQKLIVPYLIAVLFLTGCAPAVFVVGAAAGTAVGAIVYSNRGVKSAVVDRDISAKAQTMIDADQDLKFKSHISVTSFNRIVLAVGQTPKAEYRDRMVRILQGIPKVKRIYNEIVVSQPAKTSVRTKDVWITTKVKTALLSQGGLRSSDIKVVTESGTVYLLGLVSRTQGVTAAKVTSRVQGVHKVVKLFEYIH